MPNIFRVSQLLFLFIAWLFFAVDRLVQYTAIGGPCYQVSEDIASWLPYLWFWVHFKGWWFCFILPAALMYVLVPMPCLFFGGGSTQFLTSRDGGGLVLLKLSPFNILIFFFMMQPVSVYKLCKWNFDIHVYV